MWTWIYAVKLYLGTLNTSSSNGTVIKGVTLTEALKNISLAYSPLTKQLHLMTKDEELTNEDVKKGSKYDIEVNCDSIKDVVKKIKHKRTDAGSFSSTVSTLSEPSSSGSLLEAEDRISLYNDTVGVKPKKNKLPSVFNRWVDDELCIKRVYVHSYYIIIIFRNIFSWKSGTSDVSSNTSIWKIFSKGNESLTPQSTLKSRGCVRNSFGLIQHMRFLILLFVTTITT